MQVYSDKKISFKKWLLVGILLEVCIVVYSYYNYDAVNEIFRHAARYSGRLSWILYLVIFFLFSLTYKEKTNIVYNNNRKLVTIFCVLHLIHFVFLATNVYVNAIELVPIKLAGGFLGYLMIVGYPLAYKRIKRKAFHLIYFYYLGIVMAGTYLARWKGEFSGATPGTIHLIGLISIPIAFVIYTMLILRKKK